jgi:phosphoribosylformylglycinamidine cyclo-ligase
MAKAKQTSTYKDAGVDYSSMDPIKILAQKAAASTAGNLNYFGSKEISVSRGESAYVWEEADSYRALVIEGLGTKNLIADAMRSITGKTYYDGLAQDTVAMIVNDLIVVGALPQVVNAYFAIGDSAWMLDEPRIRDLITGWAAACDAINATWGGGETPTLKGVIDPKTIDLGGSAVGVINPKSRLVLGDKLASGDQIILVESSGIHANGITFVRNMAKHNPDIYKTKLSDGRMFGEAILTPTHLYVKLVRDILEAGIDVHYMVNVTGHGWRKLMRATKDFSYILDKIPAVPEEFLYMQKTANVTDEEMYGNFNMGAGFAIYVKKVDAKKIIGLANDNNFKAIIAGNVEAGPKQVVIKSKNITFSEDSLEVRS